MAETKIYGACAGCSGLAKRVDALERRERESTARTLHEHRSRLDEHDLRFDRIEGKVDRLVDSATAQSLVMDRVDVGMTMMLKAMKLKPGGGRG